MDCFTGIIQLTYMPSPRMIFSAATGSLTNTALSPSKQNEETPGRRSANFTESFVNYHTSTQHNVGKLQKKFSPIYYTDTQHNFDKITKKENLTVVA